MSMNRIQKKNWMAMNLKIFMNLMILLAAVSFTAQAKSKSFQLILEKDERSASSVEELQAIQKYFDEIESKIPEAVKSRIGNPIEIRFVNIQSDWPNRCQWNPVVGFRLASSSGRRIQLERSFRHEIILGENRSSSKACGYANAYRFAMANVIREIGRLYDEKAKFSQDPRIQTLLGSVEIGGIAPARRKGEMVSLRSPDVSEFENPREGMTVNFERFLMDPEFGCRRPTLAHLFSTEWAWDPYPARSCQINSVVPISQEEISDAAPRFVRLDPKRLYQVHYLFASKGKETMSKWGHAMYRLVFCSPTRKEVGPECLKDFSYHVVVSFRANVQEPTINSLKGLTGEYPSQLYLLSLLEVMREYNTDELRDLISVPLKLTPEQTVEFLNRSLQLFWEYRGRYLFLSNNCATEALNLLKSVVPDPSFQEVVHVVTPIGLYDSLKRFGLMEDDFLANRNSAMDQGFLMPSEKARLQRAFDAIIQVKRKGISGNVSLPDLWEDYIKNSRAEDRISWFSHLAASVSADDRVKLASSFFILESYLIRIRQAEFYRQVIELMQDDESRARVDPDGDLQKWTARAKEVQEGLTPARLAPTGYGIALQQDYRPHLEGEIRKAQSEFIQLADSLKHALEARFPERYRELLLSLENRKAFAKAQAGILN
jgi:hypothetical protein